MAIILLEGFDRYGPPVISNTTNINNTLPKLDPQIEAGGWSPIQLVSYSISAGLSRQGYAFAFTGISLTLHNAISKTFPNNYNHIIGGFRFTSDLIAYFGCAFLDLTTYQCAIYIEPITGFIVILEGEGGTLLDRSTVSVAANTEHYLEFDITFGIAAAGAFTIWLDGVQILNGLGTTQQSANNYMNLFQIKGLVQGAASDGATCQVDDLYLFDDTTSFNNAVLLSNPAIITQWPIGDSQKQFTNEGNVVGNTYAAAGFGFSDGDILANKLYLLAFTPNVNCTVSSLIVTTANVDMGAAKIKGVIYANSAGTPGSLLTDGTEVVGTRAGIDTELPLTTPQSLTAGTLYWFGFYSDTTILYYAKDRTNQGFVGTAPYVSGAPNPAPILTPNQTTLKLYGKCSGATTNWESLVLNPPLGDNSSVSAATIGIGDLYVFPALPENIVAVYGLAVGGNAKLSAPGVHDISLTVSSGGTLDTGSNPDQAITVNYAWYDSYFDTDPNTGGAWDPVTVGNATYGMEVTS